MCIRDRVIRMARLRWQRSVAMRDLVPALVELYAVNPGAALLLVDAIWDAGSREKALEILGFLARKWMTAPDDVEGQDEEQPPGGLNIGWR